MVSKTAQEGPRRFQVRPRRIQASRRPKQSEVTMVSQIASDSMGSGWQIASGAVLWWFSKGNGRIR
eukprot:513072-Pyramimonas_sp.AAC.1